MKNLFPLWNGCLDADTTQMRGRVIKSFKIRAHKDKSLCLPKASWRQKRVIENLTMTANEIPKDLWFAGILIKLNFIPRPPLSIIDLLKI